MIIEKTLFIFGAGMSKYFGYPLGSELKQLMCTTKVDYLINTKIVPEERLIYFRANLQTSICKSIDQFLAMHSGNLYFHTIGKFLIGKILFEREQERALFKDNLNPYKEIFNKLIFPKGKMINQLETFLKLPIKFITFNYDRSLEFFLFETMRSTFNLNHDQSFEALKQIEINHVYGSLFAYDGDIKKSFDEHNYGRGENGATQKLLISKLNFMRYMEDVKNEKYCKLIEESENIVFLGFAFDDFNIQVLGLQNNKLLKDKNIFSSCKGLPQSRKDVIKKWFGKDIFYGEQCHDTIEYAFSNIYYKEKRNHQE